MDSTSTSRWTGRVRGDARAVFAWWTDPKRLDEMKAVWSSQRDFEWHETRDDDHVYVATSWMTRFGTEIALRLTLQRSAFPTAGNQIIQRRRHLDGHQDHSTATTMVQFRQVEPALTEVTVTTNRQRQRYRWSELLPPTRWLTARHTRRHLSERVGRCEQELASTYTPPSPLN